MACRGSGTAALLPLFAFASSRQPIVRDQPGLTCTVDYGSHCLGSECRAAEPNNLLLSEFSSLGCGKPELPDSRFIPFTDVSLISIGVLQVLSLISISLVICHLSSTRVGCSKESKHSFQCFFPLSVCRFRALNRRGGFIAATRRPSTSQTESSCFRSCGWAQWHSRRAKSKSDGIALADLDSPPCQSYPCLP